jgi:hypothetical protein
MHIVHGGAQVAELLSLLMAALSGLDTAKASASSLIPWTVTMLLSKATAADSDWLLAHVARSHPELALEAVLAWIDKDMPRITNWDMPPVTSRLARVARAAALLEFLSQVFINCQSVSHINYSLTPSR